MKAGNDTVESISLEEAKRQVALACRRLGLLHLAFAEVLVDQLGEEEGRKTIARAITEYSRKIGRAKRERAVAQGLDPSAEARAHRTGRSRWREAHQSVRLRNGPSVAGAQCGGARSHLLFRRSGKCHGIRSAMQVRPHQGAN